jgi:hypothetical protein
MVTGAILLLTGMTTLTAGRISHNATWNEYAEIGQMFGVCSAPFLLGGFIVLIKDFKMEGNKGDHGH